MKLVAGNWKMNGLRASASVLSELVAGLATAPVPAEVLVCPPATLLVPFADLLKGTTVNLGGQCCHASETGAHTGDLSAEMIRDAGATHVIVGHSERRVDHGETDAQVAAQAKAALRAGLVPIICMGENEAAYEQGRTRAVLADQIRGSLPEELKGRCVTVAYEPIWAIGTGKTAKTSEIVDTHGFIRDTVASTLGSTTRLRILYGGSVKPSNAGEILHAPGVDGVLVGGASLKASDFLAIIASCSRP
jgi:triosephosphate isomerase